MRKTFAIAILAALVFSSRPAAAQNSVSITAQVDKAEVALNEQITLQVTVIGPQTSLPDPHIPPLPHFSLYSSGRSQNISIVNGRVSSSIEYTYVLIPRFVGKGEIPPITLDYNGYHAQTSPISIEVLKSMPAAQTRATAPAAADQTISESGTPPAGGYPDLFVTAELDKKKAYVDEQATLTVKFYSAVALAGNPQYTPPDLSGFMSEDLPPIRQKMTQINGKNYAVSEIKTAIFPTHSGRISIGPAMARCPIAGSSGADPFSQDFFNKFFGQAFGSPEIKTVSTRALEFKAVPLPANGRPDDFSGAVGRFEISALLDKNKARVGDALNLTVTIAGEGNIKAIGDPRMPQLNDFRSYETANSININKNGDHIGGSKVYKTVIIPRITGNLTISPIQFSYFDPNSGTYKTARTSPISVQVKPGTAANSIQTQNGIAIGQAAQTQASGLTPISQDIRYLDTNFSPSKISEALTAIANAGPINAIPFIFFAASLGWEEYERRRLSNPQEIRKKQAYKSALAAVAQASAQASRDPRKAADLLSQAFCGYLADKIGESPAGLTCRKAQDILGRRYPLFDEKTSKQIQKTWEDLDLMRFAPKTTLQNEQSISNDLLMLLKTIEDTLRP
ncbi:MAG: BatD family protein [Elusimicrobiota bacterium]